MAHEMLISQIFGIFFVNRTEKSIYEHGDLSHLTGVSPHCGVESCHPFCRSSNTMRKRRYNAAVRAEQQLSHPHLPSLHPVRHLSSHLLQSKLFFPNFSLTALCASHIHRPKSSRLLTRGSLPSFIHDLKSSAHDQQGYILPNKVRNCFVSLCWVRVGRSG